jgi:hypothetical protein
MAGIVSPKQSRPSPLETLVAYGRSHSYAALVEGSTLYAPLVLVYQIGQCRRSAPVLAVYRRAREPSRPRFIFVRRMALVARSKPDISSFKAVVSSITA